MVSRGVAQSGRALRSGRRGPRFESGRPDLAGFEGRVAEWLKAHDWKSCGHLPAWVRIPPRPFLLVVMIPLQWDG